MAKINAIYARQSVDKADSISIESQIDFCRYETRGAEYRIYQDKGYSGKNIERPQFQEMRYAVQNGEIGRVICYKLDRISRSILDFATMMDEFQTYGVEFVSCTEKFDTSTPMGRAMLNICIVFAQLERETIQQRVADAYHARSSKGFYMGGRIPYGYRLESYYIDGKRTSRYVADEEEAKIVQFIYSLYAEPQISYGDIVKHLIGNGIRSKQKDGCWDRSRIAEMVKNPVYVKADLSVYQFFKRQGAILHNPPEDYGGTNGCYLYSGNTGKRKTVSLEGQQVVIAPHEGIVPAGLWLRAREKCLHKQLAAKPLKASNTWLAGKIKCAKCGYALTIRKSKTKAGRYFICSRHMQTAGGCVGVGGLYAYEVEDAVLFALKERLEEFAVLKAPFSPDGTHEAQMDALAVRAEQCQDEIESLMAQLANADDVLAGYIRSRVKELDAKKGDCQKQIRQLRISAHGMQEEHQLTNYMEYWEELSVSDKMAVVDILIAVVKADETTIEITWRGSGE